MNVLLPGKLLTFLKHRGFADRPITSGVNLCVPDALLQRITVTVGEKSLDTRVWSFTEK